MAFLFLLTLDAPKCCGDSRSGDPFAGSGRAVTMVNPCGANFNIYKKEEDRGREAADSTRRREDTGRSKGQ